MNGPKLPPRLVRFPQLSSEFGIPYSNVHLLRLEKDRRFPRRIRIGGGRIAWLESEIVDWIQERIDERDR